MRTLTTSLECRLVFTRGARIPAVSVGCLAVFLLAVLLIPVSANSQSPGPSDGQTVPGSPAAPQASVPQSTPAPPDKNRAEKAYQEARRAEQSSDWKTAYAAYSEAASYAPANKEYSALREHTRFQLVQGLTDLAERRLLAGDTAGARAQLIQALEVDPNDSVARARRLELPDDSLRVAPEAGPRLAGLPQLQPKSGTRDFDLRTTIRGAYQELGRQFGVTVVFDGDLPDRAVRFRAPKVDFETALMVLGLQTRTFTRVVDAQTIFVAEDNAQKQREYAPEIEKSLILPASVTNDDMNETVRMIREITGITRTQLDTASRTLTVRSTEQNVALAQALLEQIEQPRGELMLEIEILEVDRDDAHQLGVTPPTSAQTFTLSSADVQQLQQAQNNGTLVQVLQSIFSATGALGGIGLNPLAPALIAFGGGKSIYFATVPGASVNFGQSLSAIRTAQRVLLRAQDGKAATFFVGERYPISLGLLSASLTPTTTALAALASGIAAGELSRQDYATGNSPVAVAVGDFNGDGIPDLVVANRTDGTISIFLGSATDPGTFDTPTTIKVGKSPSAVAVGDFNGDGKLDIAVANSGDNNVEILLGNGEGAFVTGVTYPTGNDPVALLATDLNTDGFLDIVTANQTDDTVSILMGKGDGTFGAKTDYPVGAGPVAIATADFIPDGFPDLVVSNHSANTISVLTQDSNGTFSTRTDYATGNGPEGVTTSDFNLDGYPDIAVANQTDGTVSIFLGSSTGAFNTRTDYAAGTGPVGIVAADFTGGDFPDIVVTDQTGDNLSVLIGAGDGTFSAPFSEPTGNGPVAVAAADLTNNGSLDVVVANQSSNSISVILNNLQSASSSSSSLPTSAQTAYPSAEYLDLGLKVKATPWLHGDNEVTLQLEFDISSLAGSAINGIPVLSNSTIEQTVRLRENQTTVLSGVIQSNQTQTVSGYPFISTVPAVGYLTGEHTADRQNTETLIVVTPRALRLPPHNPPALYAGRGEPSSPAATAPVPGLAPAPPQPPNAANPANAAIPVNPANPANSPNPPPSGQNPIRNVPPPRD